MRIKKLANVLVTLAFVASQSAFQTPGQAPSGAPKGDSSGATNTGKQDQGKQDQAQTEGPHPGASTASEAAHNLRRTLPVIPSLARGTDAMLSLQGPRATQNQLVTSTNVKDPALDAFPFAAGVPVEASEPVQIPDEQFTATLAKFYATVPVLDPISNSGWHFALGVPFFSPCNEDGLHGIRSAAPLIRATGPAFGGKLSLFESFEYRLSKTTNQSIFGGHPDSKYQSYDLNTHVDIKAWKDHLVSARFAVFSQEADFATLTAVTEPGATPDYLMRGGQFSLSDSYTSHRGLILDSSFGARYLRLHVVPQGTGPMTLVTQGEVLGNYFDTLHRSSDRFEWKEALRLPELKGWGSHQLSFGGGLARAAFDSNHIGNTIILTGEGEESVFSITNFTGSPLESLSAREAGFWVEDKWAPSRRANFTLALKYDWTTLSRQNEWAPRFGLALLPFKSDRTVIRGGIGLFYDILPLTAGTFTASQQRVVQFAGEGTDSEGGGGPEGKTLDNVTTRANLRTSHILGWNVEVDQQVTGSLFFRVKAEDRRGKNILLVNPNAPAPDVTAVVLSDNGTSRYRELEGTVSFRPTKASNMSFSYVRSSSIGDLNTYASVMGTFEKLFLSKNQYAHSRGDSTNRFLVWGDVRTLAGVMAAPALDVHTGYPFGFIDADNAIAGQADFGRFPRSFSLDLGLYRDFKLDAFDRPSKVRLGFRVYNMTDHFNPRDVEVSEIETATEKIPLFKGFLNGPGRSYRASVMFNF